MKAVTWNNLDAQPTLRDDLPVPSPGTGEVLVRVQASSINPVDNAIAAGMLKDMVPHEFPVTLGRDFAGVVEQIGDGVSAVAAGDAVFGFVPAMAPAVHAGSWAELIRWPPSPPRCASTRLSSPGATPCSSPAPAAALAASPSSSPRRPARP